MDSSSFMAIRSLFFKYLLSLLVIARFVEQEWDGQFYAQWGGRAVGGMWGRGRLFPGSVNLSMWCLVCQCE